MKALVSLAFLLTFAGCENDRLAKLEKQNTAVGEPACVLTEIEPLGVDNHTGTWNKNAVSNIRLLPGAPTIDAAFLVGVVWT
jgi:hypothetical protein